MAATTYKKFPYIGRTHFSEGLVSIRKGISSARFSLQYLRPRIRAVLLQIAAGERIHPEIVRINLSSCVKLACLKATHLQSRLFLFLGLKVVYLRERMNHEFIGSVLFFRYNLYIFIFIFFETPVKRIYKAVHLRERM